MMKSLVLWPTSRCNLKCRYCYAAGIPPEDMSEETALAALGVPGSEPFSLQIAGGEPLCNKKRTVQIIREAAKMPGCRRISIQTNATLIDDEMAEILAKYHVAIGVSIDGLPETNERTRGRTNEAVQGIRILGRHGLKTNITCVVTAANAEKLHELADMAVYLGNVAGIGLDLLRLSGRAEAKPGGALKPEMSRADADVLLKGLDGLITRLDQINSMLPENRKIVLREEYKAKQQLNHPGMHGKYCYADCGDAIVVLPDGNCTPCGSLAQNPQYDMGNVNGTIHPKSIHCGKPQECRTCEYAFACTGGCPSRGLLCGEYDPLDCVIKKYMFQRVTDNAYKGR